MNDYDDINPPKNGTAKRIYKAMKKAGCTVFDLHYNPNCWGNALEMGWGTWACKIRLRDGTFHTGFCGIVHGYVYLQGNSAPFGIRYLEELK